MIAPPTMTITRNPITAPTEPSTTPPALSNPSFAERHVRRSGGRLLSRSSCARWRFQSWGFSQSSDGGGRTLDSSAIRNTLSPRRPLDGLQPLRERLGLTPRALATAALRCSPVWIGLGRLGHGYVRPGEGRYSDALDRPCAGLHRPRLRRRDRGREA